MKISWRISLVPFATLTAYPSSLLGITNSRFFLFYQYWIYNRETTNFSPNFYRFSFSQWRGFFLLRDLGILVFPNGVNVKMTKGTFLAQWASMEFVTSSFRTLDALPISRKSLWLTAMDPKQRRNIVKKQNLCLMKGHDIDQSSWYAVRFEAMLETTLRIITDLIDFGPPEWRCPSA